MSNNSAFIILIIGICFQLPISVGDLESVFDQCCTVGAQWAQNHITCSGYPAPVPGIQATHQSVCKLALEICCIRSHRTANCEKGKEAAKLGQVCTVLSYIGGEAHKDCCEGCKLGLITASSKQQCNLKNFAFGTPWDESYYDCCIQASDNAIDDNSRPGSTPSDEAAEVDECALFPGQLCAHICVNTPESYRCECHPGFRLSENGKGCIQAPSEGRCLTNNPCQQKCIDTGVAIQCSCYVGFQLLADQRNCEDINECALGTDTCNPNTEECQNTLGGFQCIQKSSNNKTSIPGSCYLGYYYNPNTHRCEDTDECTLKTDTCNQHTELCINTIGSYSCIPHDFSQCPPGLKKDPHNEGCIDVDECAEGLHNCNLEEEMCVNSHGKYQCEPKTTTQCPAGFKFNSNRNECEDIDECAENTHNCNLETHSCINIPSSFHCVPKSSECGNGYHKNVYTNLCEDINECAIGTHDCNLVTHYCVNTAGSYQCQTKTPAIYCDRGYIPNPTTRACVDIDECTQNLCLQNQKCENTLGSYRCICHEGFNMDPLTKECKDINECQVGLHNCVQSQRCDNTIGSFTCVRLVSCGTGYTLNAETGECEDDDECRLGTHNCGPSFTCRNTEGSFRCDRVRCAPGQKLLADGTCQLITCPKGMEPDSIGNCIDINECVNVGICRQNQRCINTVGSYRCQNLLTCGSGYEVNEYGNQCVDIDECARGTQKCGANQICRNKPGGYICECPVGYIMNPQRECEDLDECVRFRGQVCSVNAECQNTVGSYLCNCKAGFRPEEDTHNCLDVDECAETPNLCHQKCINIWGSYQCTCEQGYTLEADSRTCKDIDECALWEGRRRLCIGFCNNEPGSYSCSCPDGYRLSGDKRNCHDINECEEQKPCYGDNEVCLNVRGGYKCNAIVCPPNYIRDPDHRNKLQKDATVLCRKHCRSNDIDCVLNNTQTLTYQSIAIPSIPVLPSPVILTTMRAITRDNRLSFNTDYVILEGNRGKFDVLRGTGVGSLRLIQPITGPLTVHLKLEMLILPNQRGQTLPPLSRHLAFIQVIVSQYEF